MTKNKQTNKKEQKKKKRRGCTGWGKRDETFSTTVGKIWIWTLYLDDNELMLSFLNMTVKLF